MTSEATAVLEHLTKLSAKDLKEVRARAGVLLEGVEVVSSNADSIIYAQIVILLRLAGQTQIPPLKVIKANPVSAKALREGAEPFLNYIDSYFQPRRGAERVNAIQLLLKMLMRQLVNENKLVSAHDLVQIMPRLPQIVDAEFPGYRENGFLQILLRRFHLVGPIV